MSGPRSPATKAIYAYIEANQPVHQHALNDAFRPQAAAVGTSVTSWLAQRVDNMRAAGYIEHTVKGWIALVPVAQPREPKARKAKPAPEIATSIAEPRRISMFGATYQPAPQVHRAGSDAYAAHPSLINGQPRPYRSAW